MKRCLIGFSLLLACIPTVWAQDWRALDLPKDSIKAGQAPEVPLGEHEWFSIPWRILEVRERAGAIPIAPGAPAVSIALSGRAASLRVLHALHVGPGLKAYRDAVLESVNKGTDRPDFPVVAQYVIRYADGARAPFDIRYGESIEGATRRTFEPVSRFIGDLAWASIAWQGAHDYEKDERAVLYAMRIPNPRPEAQLAALEVVAAGPSNCGAVEIYAASAEAVPAPPRGRTLGALHFC